MKSIREQCAILADRNLTENEFIQDVLEISSDKNRDVARTHAVAAMGIADGLANLTDLTSDINITVSRCENDDFIVIAKDAYMAYTPTGLIATAGFMPPRRCLWDRMITSILSEIEHNENSEITRYPYTWTLDGNEPALTLSLRDYKGSKARSYPTMTVLKVPAELLDLVNRATGCFHTDRVIVKDAMIINGVPGVGEDELVNCKSSAQQSLRVKEEFELMDKFISEFEKTLPHWATSSKRANIFTGEITHQPIMSTIDLPLGNFGKGSLILVMHIE